MHTVQQGHQTWYILFVKIVVKKAGSEKIFMLVISYGTSILVFYFSRSHKASLILIKIEEN